MADIDIDTSSNFTPSDLFNIIPASIISDSVIRKHTVGVYFQKIPQDPITKFAAIPYKYAADYDYFKIDFLHLSVYDQFTSKQQIRDILKLEPDWDLLKDKEVVEQLFQISKHFNIIQKIKPKSINDLADCVAIIRPYKRYLLEDYLHDKYYIRKFKLYNKEKQSDYRKSHAIAYATVITLQMYLIKQTGLYGSFI